MLLPHNSRLYVTQTPVAAQPPVTDFAGCAVLSNNGSGNVVYLDKQASSSDGIDPGFITLVQLPASGQTVTMQNRSYTESTIADLATAPTTATAVRHSPSAMAR